jgi:geranylgeranyl diphosphate synthase, type I
MTEPALRAAVERLPSAMRRIAGYHLGWWNADGAATPGAGGKSVRAALVLLSAEAAGGDAAAAVDAAVAVELVHNFSLLHDDIMDGDVTRRHKPAAWSVFGVPDAILAGDAMLALAADVIAQAPQAVRRLMRCVVELCEGQSADVAFESRAEVSLQECMAMARGKTGALLGCACALGALSAGAHRKTVTGFDDFGRALGLAFQLVDDLLGIWGDPAVTGKPVHADLSARKKSLPVVAALTAANSAGRTFALRYTADEPLHADELPHLAELIETTGARRWANRQAEHHMRVATHTLNSTTRSTQALVTLAHFITRRDR